MYHVVKYLYKISIVNVYVEVRGRSSYSLLLYCNQNIIIIMIYEYI